MSLEGGRHPSTLLTVSGRLGRVDLLLSVQGALLGAVGDSLYGGCAELHDDLIVLTWYVRPGMPEDEREDLEIAGTNVIADFPEPFHIDERFVDVVDPSKPLPTAGEWVFLRRGVLVR
jgi:hypothetical protein